MNPAFTDGAGIGDANVFAVFDAFMERRNGQNRIFIAGNCLTNARQGAGDAVKSRAFAVNNFISGVADTVIDLGFNFRGERFVVNCCQFFNRNRAGVGIGPD